MADNKGSFWESTQEVESMEEVVEAVWAFVEKAFPSVCFMSSTVEPPRVEENETQLSFNMLGFLSLHFLAARASNLLFLDRLYISHT